VLVKITIVRPLVWLPYASVTVAVHISGVDITRRAESQEVLVVAYPAVVQISHI
jgi:hypothetical protein